MSYSIKAVSVILTCQQFRDIISVLENIERDPDVASAVAEKALLWLTKEGLLNSLDFPRDIGYDHHAPLPWERSDPG